MISTIQMQIHNDANNTVVSDSRIAGTVNITTARDLGTVVGDAHTVLRCHIPVSHVPYCLIPVQQVPWSLIPVPQGTEWS